MDRFIEVSVQEVSQTRKRLKSNMDRFIVYDLERYRKRYPSLKSNMDRFIAIFKFAFFAFL